MNKLIAEFIGTFFLVFAIGMTGNPLAIGAMLMVMVYFSGNISGAQFNPAVSLGIFIRGKMSASEMIQFMAVQIAGALAASYFVYLLTNKTFAPVPLEGINILKPLAVEMVCTFALMTVILAVATTKKAVGNSYYGLAIGFTITACAYTGGGVSGGAFNPAVGIGPALIDTLIGGNDSLSNVWIYIVGPATGAAVAAFVFKMTNPGEE